MKGIHHAVRLVLNVKDDGIVNFQELILRYRAVRPAMNVRLPDMIIPRHAMYTISAVCVESTAVVTS